MPGRNVEDELLALLIEEELTNHRDLARARQTDDSGHRPNREHHAAAQRRAANPKYRRSTQPIARSAGRNDGYNYG